MAFSVKEIDADQYRITLAGIPIAKGAGLSGYADGEFFNAEQVNDSFKLYEGTDGSVTRSKTNSRIANCFISLAQSASSNALLSALLVADENQPNGAGIGTLIVQNLQGTDLLVASRCWIVKRAPAPLDRISKERKWPLLAVWDTWIVGGS